MEREVRTAAHEGHLQEGPSSKKVSSPQRRPDQRIQLYCGNNARDEGLINGTKILGTRYQCLKERNRKRVK